MTEILNREQSLRAIMHADMSTTAPADAPSRHWDEQFLAGLEEQGLALVRTSPDSRLGEEG